ncbi:uncharacterized protein LOC129305998 isoform X2 [Prosopis cineraria]|uniref:uncharacterized protein LOC129305998 isoform X2 n=1 Tax=Prosopis cineraria TaxID=364024 RepID=UPI00240F9A92|nr:uncharacterized protein LOC129305998 isoform X2 [Prosopis cineraria]
MTRRKIGRDIVHNPKHLMQTISSYIRKVGVYDWRHNLSVTLGFRQWFSALEKMELNDSGLNNHQSHSSEGSHDARKEISAGKEGFVNHAEIAWHQERKEWVGDRSKRLLRPPRESIMSLTTSYEDLLLSTEPFQQPIPLAEMVDFLVDIWHEEGLYD